MMHCSFISAILFAVILGSTNAFFSHSNINARRTSSSLHMTILTANGQKIEFKEGSPLSSACAKLGVKPKYSCKRGDCGSCTVSVGGTRIKACVGKVPPMPRLKSLQEKGLEVK
ncbi:hypothetical protein ACHAXH_000952 [Discostella pseudostelligera]